MRNKWTSQWFIQQLKALCNQRNPPPYGGENTFENYPQCHSFSMFNEEREPLPYLRKTGTANYQYSQGTLNAIETCWWKLTFQTDSKEIFELFLSVWFKMFARVVSSISSPLLGETAGMWVGMILADQSCTSLVTHSESWSISIQPDVSVSPLYDGTAPGTFLLWVANDAMFLRIKTFKEY